MYYLIKPFFYFIFLLFSYAAPLCAYQAFIFDCDGVLVDTEHLKYLAWKKALIREGIPFDKNMYLPLVGLSSLDIAQRIKAITHQDFNEKALITRKDQIYWGMQKRGVPVLPDALDFLKNALSKKKDLQVKIGIASSATHQEILENLNQMGISPEEFDIILSGKDDLTHIHDPEGVNKPKPYIYQLCAKRLGIEPHHILVFEDSAAGVDAAYFAGMDVIAVPNKFTTNHDFSRAIQTSSFTNLDITKLITNIVNTRDF